jgi:choice-of-anchor C domain-containing protein
MKFSKTWLAALALAATAPMASAAPNLITNGSFESNGIGFSGGFSTIYTGSSTLTGWTINAGNVDLVNTYWTASQGHYSLDLSGEQDGTISQSFATVVGQKYQVSFDVAGNPTDSDKVKYLQVGLSNLPLYEFDTTGKTHSNMGWTTKNFVFQAVSTSSTLFFAGLQDSPYGVALDNVSVSAVPEPETYALLLAGMGLVGAAARRKRANAR